MQLSGKIIILFCPTFFGYEREIKRTLEQLGATVIWFDDRPSNSFYSKALIRLNKNLLSRKIRNYYRGIYDTVKSLKVDYLFFVNPEAISIRSLLELKNAFPTAKSILYMWDSLSNRKQNIDLLCLFDSKFTFDPVDAINHNLKLRPLFYTNTYKSDERRDRCFDLLFIGTAHSDRYSFVKKLTNTLEGKRYKLYFYLSSKLLFIYKKLVDRQFISVKFGDLSFKSLSHSDISHLMNLSVAVLDVNHPSQKGLTMRTMEAMATGCKLITTNIDITKYDFYNAENILVVDRNLPIVGKSFFEKPYVPVPEAIQQKYSISGWIQEIFQDQ